MRRLISLAMTGWRVLVPVLACASSIVGCASNSTPERSFATLADARAGGGFEPGWLPESIVPASAKNIRSRRDLGTNEIWARFDFEEADRTALPAGCTRVGQEGLRLPARETRGIGWWPEMLRGDPGVAVQQFEIYRCGGTALLAIHRSLATAFYWRGRAEPTP